MNSTDAVFLAQSVKYIELNLPRIKICLDRITESEVWWKPNDQTNSIANLIIHLSGNIRQYIVSGIGGKADIRKRELEFTDSNTMSKSELLQLLSNTVTEAISIIKTLNSSALSTEMKLQGFQMTGTEAIIHVTEHFSYHTGQIALITKMIKNEDLGFYAGKNLNILNK